MSHHVSEVWYVSEAALLKVSIELPVTSRLRRDMTVRLLKATLSLNKIKKNNLGIFSFQVEICLMDLNLMSYPRLRGSFSSLW